MRFCEMGLKNGCPSVSPIIGISADALGQVIWESARSLVSYCLRKASLECAVKYPEIALSRTSRAWAEPGQPGRALGIASFPASLGRWPKGLEGS